MRHWRRIASSCLRFQQAGSTPSAAPSLAWVPARPDSRAQKPPGAPEEGELPAAKPKRQDRGASGRASRLTEQIEALATALLPAEDEEKLRDEMVHELRRRIQVEIPGGDLVTFGSAATGLWLPGRDVDLSLKVPGLHSGRTEIKQALHRVAHVIYSFSGDKPENRLAAKVPLLRWAPSSASLPCFDITVNNLLAVENSRLISSYVAAEPLLRKLLVVIKTWAAERGINDRSRGTLSSFALTLMAVHMLQRRRVLPSLQDLAILRGDPRHNVMDADCRFCADPELIEAEKAKLASLRSSSSESLGAWLLDFFRYYGTEYKGGVIATRSGAAAGMWRSTSSTGQFYFVDNPFEPGIDVANVELGQLARLREEFRSAHSRLRRGASVEEICGVQQQEEPDADGC